jgi:hypothetical protein
MSATFLTLDSLIISNSGAWHAFTDEGNFSRDRENFQLLLIARVRESVKIVKCKGEGSQALSFVSYSVCPPARVQRQMMIHTRENCNVKRKERELKCRKSSSTNDGAKTNEK